MRWSSSSTATSAPLADPERRVPNVPARGRSEFPSTGYGSFVKAISTIGELESSSQEAQDVSEEFYDVQARLKNKKVEEARLVELLQKATGKLTEVLQVEKELSRIREEIEQIEGRLRFLTNQTDLSTITVTINEVKQFRPAGPPSLSNDISRTFSESIGQLGDAARGLLLIVIAVLPWAVYLGLSSATYSFERARRNRR